jgi:hypothetical protein
MLLPSLYSTRWLYCSYSCSYSNRLKHIWGVTSLGTETLLWFFRISPAKKNNKVAKSYRARRVSFLKLLVLRIASTWGARETNHNQIIFQLYLNKPIKIKLDNYNNHKATKKIKLSPSIFVDLQTALPEYQIQSDESASLPVWVQNQPHILADLLQNQGLQGSRMIASWNIICEIIKVSINHLRQCARVVNGYDSNELIY